MNLNKFLQKEKPWSTQLRLEPFKNGIYDLKARGYSLSQINNWLSNYEGISVSLESLRKFIIKNQG